MLGFLGYIFVFSRLLDLDKLHFESSKGVQILKLMNTVSLICDIVPLFFN